VVLNWQAGEFCGYLSHLETLTNGIEGTMLTKRSDRLTFGATEK
jgi:hypothetical protein